MDPTAASGSTWLFWTIVILIVVLALVVWYAARKNRRLPGEHVFRASRWTRGNRIFPAQVAITKSSITMLQPEWIGKREESVHVAHVSSIQIETNVLFSDVSIETTGGHNPLVCHGHTKSDAIRMKQTIEGFQSEYYKKP